MPSSSSSSSSYNTESSATFQKTSVVRTKCWSIAPLWKFVTYELEQDSHSAPRLAGGNTYYNNILPHRLSMPSPHHKSRRPSKNRGVISYENDVNGMAPTACDVKAASKVARRPLQPRNTAKANENATVDPEPKPCGVLKKPGSYRGHAGLKKVAFLENTELNRSTL